MPDHLRTNLVHRDQNRTTRQRRSSQQLASAMNGHFNGIAMVSMRRHSLMTRTESTLTLTADQSPDPKLTPPDTPEPFLSSDHGWNSNGKSRKTLTTLFGETAEEIPSEFDQTHVDVSTLQEVKDAEPKQGSIVTIFALWNTMMGTSLLIMPWAIAQSGYFLGIGLTVFLGGLSYYTCTLVLQTCKKQLDPGDERKVLHSEFSDFGDAIDHYLGKRLSYFGVVISLLTFLGVAITYWIFMTRSLFTIGNVIYDYTWNTNHTGHDAIDSSQANLTQSYGLFEKYWSSTYTVPIYLIIVLYPISCVREPTVFTKFNAAGICSVMILISYVIYQASLWGINMDAQSDNSIRGFNSKFPAISGSLSLGFFSHIVVLPITAHHEKPANKKRDLGIAYFLAAVTYLCVGVAYYITYPGAKKDIPDNFLRLVTKEDFYGIVSSMFLLFQLVTVYPLLLFILRNQFMAKIIRKFDYGYPWIFGINIGVVTACLLLAIFWPRVGDLIRILGAVSGFVHIYTFPCLVYLAALRGTGQLKKMTIFLHVLIIVFGILNLVGQFVIPLD